MNRTLLPGLSCILFAGCGGMPKTAFATAPASQAPSNVVNIPPDSPILTLESPEANAATMTYRQSESAVIGRSALPLRRL